MDVLFFRRDILDKVEVIEGRFCHAGRRYCRVVAGAADFGASCRLITDQTFCIGSYHLFSGSNLFLVSCNMQYSVSCLGPNTQCSTDVPTSDNSRIVC